MSSDSAQLTGPDLRQGIAFDDLQDGGMLAGHAGGEPVLLARRGEDVFAIGAVCTHYSGPLADGLMLARRFAARGTTPVSPCAPAKRFGLPRSTPFPAGGWSGETGPYMFKKKSNMRRDPRFRHHACREPSSS